jgi:hypothetical protein
VYKTARMDAYLTHRSDSKSAAYYIQYPVPKDVQPLLSGRRYERRTCGTSDLSVARRVAAALVASWELDFAEKNERNALGSDMLEMPSGQKVESDEPYMLPAVMPMPEPIGHVLSVKVSSGSVSVHSS